MHFLRSRRQFFNFIEHCQPKAFGFICRHVSSTILYSYNSIVIRLLLKSVDLTLSYAGSYSCATLRSHVIAQHALYKDFSKSVDFAMIYISEAHAKDEWPLGTKFSWDQPKTIEERIAIAKKFQEETKYKIPLYADTIEGSFEKYVFLGVHSSTKFLLKDINNVILRAFECWPERWWLIYKNRVAMQGISQTGDASDYEQLVLWLKVYKTTL